MFEILILNRAIRTTVGLAALGLFGLCTPDTAFAAAAAASASTKTAEVNIIGVWDDARDQFGLRPVSLVGKIKLMAGTPVLDANGKPKTQLTKDGKIETVLKFKELPVRVTAAQTDVDEDDDAGTAGSAENAPVICAAHAADVAAGMELATLVVDEPKEKSQWTYTFENLPVRTKDGTPIRYVVIAEKAARGYSDPIIISDAQFSGGTARSFQIFNKISPQISRR
jgi:hypothetical protein